MSNSLERNLCSPPDYSLNSEVVDLLKRIEGSGIHGALEYACRSWSRHLVIGDWVADVFHALHCLLEEKFIFWLEVLCHGCCVKLTVD